jgi:hypothetical protein
MRNQGVTIDPTMLGRLSPLGWDHINLTGDYVWAENVEYDAEGFSAAEREALP